METNAKIAGGDLPNFKIIPVPHGRWALLKKLEYVTFGGKLSYIMREVSTYDTYQGALDDVKHLGLEA